MNQEESLSKKGNRRRSQAIVGGAMHLSHLARYDISYAVNQMAKAMSTPSPKGACWERPSVCFRT